jgi:hypothetical protein
MIKSEHVPMLERTNTELQRRYGEALETDKLRTWGWQTRESHPEAA